jgi:hypothetical protein
LDAGAAAVARLDCLSPDLRSFDPLFKVLKTFGFAHNGFAKKVSHGFGWLTIAKLDALSFTFGWSDKSENGLGIADCHLGFSDFQSCHGTIAKCQYCDGVVSR